MVMVKKELALVHNLKNNKMKNLKYLIICMFFVSTGCKKEKIISTENKVIPLRDLIHNLSSSYTLNDEGWRIFDDISDPDYSFGIIDNLNFGHFGTSQNFPIYLSGQTEPNITLTLNNQVFNPVQNGDWFLRDNNLKNYYGTVVDIDISINGQHYQAQRYIPIPVQVQDLSQNNSIYIDRNGNNLTWNVDPLNAVEKIALYYILYNNDEYGSSNGAYSNGVLLLDNNGSFDISSLLTEDATKRISFQVASGNTFSFQHNNLKYLFNIASVDHHEYLLLD